LIIGAGLAGLATGCYAQMNGYRSRILSTMPMPGGGCCLAARDYLIDGGSTL
jgi:phytoene dehydrogenase-like protein